MISCTMYNYTKISCGESNLFHKISSIYEKLRKKLMLNKTKIFSRWMTMFLFENNANCDIASCMGLLRWKSLTVLLQSTFRIEVPAVPKFNKILKLISFNFPSLTPRLSRAKITKTWNPITFINILILESNVVSLNEKYAIINIHIFLKCRWNLETQFWTTTTSKHMEIYGISPIKKKKRTSEPASR